MAGPTVAPPARVRGWLLLPLLAAACFFAPVPAWIVDDFYSRDLFPWLQGWLTALSNLAPFAVLDALILITAVGVIARIVLLWGTARERGLFAAAWESVRRLVRVVAAVVLVFTWSWGCNYRRLPLEAGLQNGVGVQPTVADLQAAIAQANTLAASLRPGLVAASPLSYEEVAATLADPMRDALQQLNRVPLTRTGRPKSSYILTPFFSWAGVDGMIDPLVLESIVHPDLLPFEKPFVLAHEWAHLAGQADEAEASAVGWLACMHGPPPLAYSASLYLIMEAASVLPLQVRKRSIGQLDAGVYADLSAISHRAEVQQKPEVQRAASRVYDHYLRANRVEDGNASYSRALTLILAEPLHGLLTRYKK